MSKLTMVDTGNASAVTAATGSLTALENLAGFAEDINNQAIGGLADPAVLEATVKQRFGDDVSLKDVTDALDALNSISLGL